jgi:acetyl esterase/lipase
MEDPNILKPGVRSHYYTTSDIMNTHPLVSPIFARDHSSLPLPPVYIHVGECERLRDEALQFGLNQRHSPVSVELYHDQVHAFQTFGDPEGLISLKRVGETIMRFNSPIKNRFSLIQGNGEEKILTVEQIKAILDEGQEELEKIKAYQNSHRFNVPCLLPKASNRSLMLYTSTQ